MTGSTQAVTYTSPGPIRMPPGSYLEPVEELPSDSDPEDYGDFRDVESVSDIVLSNIEEEEEDDDDEGQGSLRERDPVFEKIKESLSKTQRSESAGSFLSSESNDSDGPHVQISEHYTSLPYGIQPKATYEHSGLHADIMGVAYNGRMRQFVILDSKGITTWKRDLVDPRVRRALQFPKYEYCLIRHIVFVAKYNCYFALSKDFSVKVLNRDFEETCSVNTNMRSVLFILFNPVRDELITGGVGGIKIWNFVQAAGKVFTELKPLANYELRLKESLPNVGGSWVKRVDLDYQLQHLYCCSDTDLHVYDLSGKLLFKFERAHTMSITGCCFSPTSKVLITSSVDSDVKVWSLTGGLVHTFRGHSRAVTSLMLHPETSSIIMTASLDGSIRMWSLDTMDLLYMIVVSADGVMWMGLTDDKLLYISTCRNITLWHLNTFYSFWALARSQVTTMSLASAEEKTTRILAVGDDNSVRIFNRSNKKNMTTVLPPPDISPLRKVLSLCYSREKNAAFLLVSSKEIWVYTTRTDPSCRIAVWNVHDLQVPYISGDTTNLPAGVTIQPPSQSLSTHRATPNGHGNEIISNCCSLCILNSTAMMWTEEGLCCPLRHTYLLLGMEDGRILFMDPVIRGQKYMEFKASKDAIREMRQDRVHSSLVTLCRLKTLVQIQIWGLPQLDLLYELFCGSDITCYERVGLTMLTGHTSGQINYHMLEPAEDLGLLKSKQEPSCESVVDENRRPEHQGTVVAMDCLASLRLFVTCSLDGAIKVWDETKVLMTEVMLEESLSAACFLNDMGDLLVGFKNHIFFIDHTKLCPAIKPEEVEMETSDQESDVYEDPRVLYELLKEEDEEITLQNYLVPYDHLEFDKDFLEGKTKIEQPKTAAEAAAAEETESETETDISLAPSSIYLSPADSIESLSMIDLTLGADYSKYDLKDQMKVTLDMVAKGKKKRKHVTIEALGQSDLEEKEVEVEMEKFSLPTFGESPGGSPSITPPSGQVSPRSRHREGSEDEWSDEERIQKKPRELPAGFIPVEPDQEGKPAQKIEKPKAIYGDEPEVEVTGSRRMKGVKVDVRGLMKKRRITSARAPSLTRRASTDHAHDDHDHDHDHSHDDHREIKKKQQQPIDRRLQQKMDKNKLMNLPPNPPSMLSRKRSLSEQRKNFELNLLHRPELRSQQLLDPDKMPHIRMEGDPDLDQLQEAQWAAEAGIHGTTLTLPPQRDKNQARQTDRPDQRSQRNRDRKFMLGDKDTPGVGSSPTSEMESPFGDREKKDISPKVNDGDKDRGGAGENQIEEEKVEKDGDFGSNLDTNQPETQMQRAKRLGLKVDVDKVFEMEKADKEEGLPKVNVQRTKLKVYIPQAERESTSSARSSYRGSPDSGIEDLTGQLPQTPVITVKQEEDKKPFEDGDQSVKDLTDEERKSALARPATSFTGLRRGQIEGEKLKTDRPHTAHVRFKAEDLQTAFEEALKKYQNLPGTPKLVSADTLYRNDGVNFEENWQERAIERHTLLRMQKEIRAQSAAQRRQAIEMIKQDKSSSKLFTTRCHSAVPQTANDQSSTPAFRRANTSLSVPISFGYGVSTAPPPSSDKPRPKTANPVILKQQAIKNELSQEKAYRYKMGKSTQTPSRPSSSKSIATVADFSPHWIDPRNPDAWRPKSSRSIPSKCNRYVLVNKPKEKPTNPVPSPLEEQLLIERFPRMGAKVVQPIPDLTPRMKKSYQLEYSPFVYHRYM